MDFLLTFRKDLLHMCTTWYSMTTAFPQVILFSLRGRIRGYLIRKVKDYYTLAILVTVEKDTKGHSSLLYLY